MQRKREGFGEWSRARLRALETFVRRDIWLHLPESRSRKALYQLLRMGVLIVEGFAKSEVFILAAALTYQVIFALVPLLVVMLAVVKGFGGLTSVGEQVQKWLIAYITPQVGDELVARINDFVANVNAAAVGVLGFAVLLYITLSFLTTIENAFNKIWGIKSSRTLLRRFTIYWTLLTVSPILVAASLSMTAFVQSNSLYEWLVRNVPYFGKVALTLTPYIVAWVMFTGFYLFMPNTRVKITAALTGALVSGTAWQAMTSLYTWYNTKVVTAYTFYGSLGAIPVFLLWVYLSWIIVLFGAEVAFAVQHVGTYRREVEQVRVSSADRDRLALLLAVEAVKPFQAGQPAPTAEEVAARLNTPVRVVHEILYQLAAKGVLREVTLGDRKDPGYLPGRDPSLLTARDVLVAVRTFGDPSTLPEGPEAAAIYRLLDCAETDAMAPLAKVTLRELASPASPPSPQAIG